MACASVYQDAGSAYVAKLPTPPINFQISKHAPGLNGRNRNLYAAWMIFLRICNFLDGCGGGGSF